MTPDIVRAKIDVPPASSGSANIVRSEVESTPSTGIVEKARDLETLRGSLADAGSVGTTLWLSYIFVLFYFAVAAGGVTHQDLFFDAPVRLPFLGVDLPLLGFFVLGPALVVLVHMYLMLHLVLLSAKAGAFDTELRRQVLDERDRWYLRRQLPSNVFIQFLAGPRDVRSGIVGFLLRLVAQISVIVAPVMLLVFFQLQFLPYHNETITCWHRIAVMADMALLWVLWPTVARGKPTSVSWWYLARRRIVPAILSLMVLVTIVTVATFPTESLESILPTLRWIPWKEANDPEWRLTSLHEVLVAGRINLITREPTSLWSNRLVLPGLDVIDHIKADSEAKIAALSLSVSLRGRRLEGAVLIDARLTKADFTAAHLQGASLSFARLDGASLVGAQLQGASLDGAQFPGSSLLGAQLQGASFDGAQLQGASLVGAQLQGASLNGTQLQGASLDGAQLQGASLDFVQLQAASLIGVQLQGALLERAQLDGAVLNGAQLQGALLNGASLERTSLKNVFVWRTDVRNGSQKGAPIVEVVTDRKEQCSTATTDYVCEWSKMTLSKLQELIINQVPESDARRIALDRIVQRLDPNIVLDGEDKIVATWNALRRSNPSPDDYEKSLSQQWRQIGCGADGAPNVIRGLIRALTNLNFSFAFGPQSLEPNALAKAFLDEAQCPGSRGLSNEDKASLIKIRDRRG